MLETSNNFIALTAGIYLFLGMKAASYLIGLHVPHFNRMVFFSVYGWPPVEYNQLLPAAATQTYGEAAYQGIHTQSEKKNLFFYNCNDIHLFMIISSVLVVVQAKKTIPLIAFTL